jgi:hypothetical protein
MRWLKGWWRNAFQLAYPSPTWKTYVRSSYNRLPQEFRDRWLIQIGSASIVLTWSGEGHEPIKPIYSAVARVSPSIPQAEFAFQQLLSSMRNEKFTKTD